MPVLIKDVAIYPLPYLEPSVAADRLGAKERTHAGVLRAAMDRVRADAGPRPGASVVMAHAFVTGGATSESERDISVGGVSAVHPDVFADADYVALGHLHGPQRICETARYSGSPIALSFSEADHRKGSVLVEVSAGGVDLEVVPAPVTKSLEVLRGNLAELLVDARHRSAESAYCQITLTDAVRPMGAMEQLRRRFPDALVLTFEPVGAQVVPRTSTASVRQRGDLDLCCDFLGHVRAGNAASQQERALLATAVESSRLVRGELEDEGRTTSMLDTRRTGAA